MDGHRETDEAASALRLRCSVLESQVKDLEERLLQATKDDTVDSDRKPKTPGTRRIKSQRKAILTRAGTLSDARCAARFDGDVALNSPSVAREGPYDLSIGGRIATEVTNKPPMSKKKYERANAVAECVGKDAG
eukprot:Rmarinus@m.29711